MLMAALAVCSAIIGPTTRLPTLIAQLWCRTLRPTARTDPSADQLHNHRLQRSSRSPLDSPLRLLSPALHSLPIVASPRSRMLRARRGRSALAFGLRSTCAHRSKWSPAKMTGLIKIRVLTHRRPGSYGSGPLAVGPFRHEGNRPRPLVPSPCPRSRLPLTSSN